MSGPAGRVVQGLRRRDWGGALGEVILIAFGILGALWVDGCVEGRADRQAERQSLQLLDRDLAQSIEQLEESSRVFDATSSAGLRVYSVLVGPLSEVDRESVSNDLGQLVVRRTVRLPRASYTDLLSTGNIRLVRDVELRDLIAQFYESAEQAEAIIDLNNSSFTDGQAVPFLLGEGLILPRPLEVGFSLVDSAFARIQDELGEDFEHPTDPIWDVPEGSHIWDRARTLGLNVGRNSAVQRQLAEGLLDEARRLRRAVQDYLRP